MDANVSYPLSGLSVNNMNNQLITRVETITPVLAEEYLRRNTKNRQLRSNIVGYYASQMKNGQWMLNGEGIIFNEEDVLVDGQHRLAAVIESGVDVDMLVVRNADKDSFTTVDCGISRKISDTFFVKGIPNANVIASIIGRYIKLCSNQPAMGAVTGRKDASTSSRCDLLQEYISDEDFWQDICRRSLMWCKALRIMPQSEAGGMAAYLIKKNKHSPEMVFGFFEDLLKNDIQKSPMLAMFRRRLIASRNSNKKRLVSAYKQQLFTQVWNAYVEGRELRCLKWDETREDKKTLK